MNPKTKNTIVDSIEIESERKTIMNVEQKKRKKIDRKKFRLHVNGKKVNNSFAGPAKNALQFRSIRRILTVEFVVCAFFLVEVAFSRPSSMRQKVCHCYEYVAARRTDEQQQQN